MNPFHLSQSMLHITPPDILQRVRQLFEGEIDLDPASNWEVNQQLVQAKTFYNDELDGLQQPWFGSVFLNPPGGRVIWEPSQNRYVPTPHGGLSSQQVWWQKLYNAYKEGEVEQAVYLGFNAQILHRQPELFDFPICFVRKRIAFYQPSDRIYVPNRNPTHNNILVYLPGNCPTYRIAKFHHYFHSYGRIILDHLEGNPWTSIA